MTDTKPSSRSKRHTVNRLLRKNCLWITSTLKVLVCYFFALSLDKTYHNYYLALSRFCIFGYPCSLKEVFKQKLSPNEIFDFFPIQPYLHDDDICECSVHWPEDSILHILTRTLNKSKVLTQIFLVFVFFSYCPLGPRWNGFWRHLDPG